MMVTRDGAGGGGGGGGGESNVLVINSKFSFQFQGLTSRRILLMLHSVNLITLLATPVAIVFTFDAGLGERGGVSLSFRSNHPAFCF